MKTTLDYAFQCPLWVTNTRIWVGPVSTGIDPSSIVLPIEHPPAVTFDGQNIDEMRRLFPLRH